MIVLKAKEVVTHRAVVEVFVADDPRRVPSGFYAADVILALDDLLEQKMLPEGDNNRVEAALAEGRRIKRAVGALRYLFRSGPRGRDPAITELKAMLAKCKRGKPDATEMEEASSDSDDLDGLLTDRCARAAATQPIENIKFV